MFDRFGEFDSAEEINELAENLFNEGDLQSLREMAKENGIFRECVDLYIQGESPELCDEFDAAIGKIQIETADLKPKGIMEDWIEYLKCQCAESEKLSIAVRKKDKSLKGCIGALLKWSFANQWPIGKDILDAAGVKAGKVTLGIPGMGQAKKIIKEYYLGK